MKKLSIIVIVLILSGCKKEYTCDCVYKFGGDTTKTEVIKATKNRAKKKCRDNALLPYGGGYIMELDCKLRE